MCVVILLVRESNDEACDMTTLPFSGASHTACKTFGTRKDENVHVNHGRLGLLSDTKYLHSFSPLNYRF